MKTTLDKMPLTKDIRLLRRIFNTLNRFDNLQTKIIMDVIALDKHYRNKIAAHKAHLTMAKNKGISRKDAKGGTR